MDKSGRFLATWIREYEDPDYWNTRTPLWLGLPTPINFYLNLNDNKLRSFLKKQKGRVLDVGCGDGRFLEYAEVGVEFSRGMLSRARRRHRDKAVLAASATYLPIRDHVFDVAFMTDVMVHINPNRRHETRIEVERVSRKLYIFENLHRSVFPIVYLTLRKTGLKPRRFLAYLSFLLSFPIDRLTRLKTQEGYLLYKSARP